MPENIVTVDDIISLLKNKLSNDPEAKQIMLALQHGNLSLPICDNRGAEFLIELKDISVPDSHFAFPRIIK